MCTVQLGIRDILASSPRIIESKNCASDPIIIIIIIIIIIVIIIIIAFHPIDRSVLGQL